MSHQSLLICPPFIFKSHITDHLIPDIYEGFPQVIRDIVNDKSRVIKCTFNPGPQLWDAEAELNKHQPHSAEIWDKLRRENCNMFFWRKLEPREWIDDLVYEREILPYESGDEYFSD